MNQPNELNDPWIHRSTLLSIIEVYETNIAYLQKRLNDAEKALDASIKLSEALAMKVMNLTELSVNLKEKLINLPKP